MQCSHCNQEHPEGTLFCPVTSKKIIMPDICPQCGKPVDPNWLYCTYCGRTLTQPEENSDQQEAQAVGDPQAPVTPPELSKTKIGSPKVRRLIIGGLIIAGGIGGLIIIAMVVFNVFWKGANHDETSTSVAALSTPLTKAPEHIIDLVERNLITVKVTGVGIDALAVHVQSNSVNPLQINIPAATYFVAENVLVQNMVVRHSFTTLIQPRGEVDIILDAACANLRRAEPSNKDTFTILRTSEQPELTKVIDKLNSIGVDYPVGQAAIWIITDNATYDELGMLVRDSRFGPPMIEENEAVRAMMLIDEAGIDILKYAIWQDRAMMTPKVTEPDLVAWLSKRGGTVATQSTPGRDGTKIEQFATAATASSQYSTPNWSAMQAVGAPNTTSCGDSSSAWASLQSKSKDWLLLTYDQPVIPTRIVIYQTFHPGAIALVEVVDEVGNSSTVYEAGPTIVSKCPYTMEINVTDVDKLVNSIRITIDQSNHNGWNEIDAVQLIGVTR